MIKNSEFIQTCLHHLQSLRVGEKISFKTAKKDREIAVSKKEYIELEHERGILIAV